MTRAVIWINGNEVSSTITKWATAEPTPHIAIAADGGLDAARAAGCAVDVLVGDLDSVSDNARQSFVGSVLAHDADKDATDLELAFEVALGTGGVEDVVVVGGGGGRLDHELASLLALADDRYAAVRVRALLGTTWVTVLRPGPAWSVSSTRHSPLVGSLLSLLPVGGAATGVRTTGLRWPLRGETLHAGEARGMSNIVDDNDATVALESGVLLALQSQPEG